MHIRQMLNVAKWQSGDVARAEPNMFELCRAFSHFGEARVALGQTEFWARLFPNRKWCI